MRLCLTGFQLGGVILQILRCFLRDFCYETHMVTSGYYYIWLATNPCINHLDDNVSRVWGSRPTTSFHIFSAHIFSLSEVTAIAIDDSPLEHQGKAVLTASSV